jgi:hypothetical protein
VRQIARASAVDLQSERLAKSFARYRAAENRPPSRLKSTARAALPQGVKVKQSWTRSGMGRWS